MMASHHQGGSIEHLPYAGGACPYPSGVFGLAVVPEWPTSYTRWPYATPSRGNPLYQAGWDGHMEWLPVSMVGELADVTEGNWDTMFCKVCPDVTGSVAAITPPI